MLERIRNQITDLRKEEERRFTYELECSFDKEHSIEYSEWINTIRDISDRDKIKIYLVSEGEDTLHLDENMEDEYIQFLDSLDDDEIVDVLVQVAKQTQVVRRSVFVARLRVFAEVAADDLVRTAVAQVADGVFHPLVVEAHPVDQRVVFGQPEQARARIARLRFRGDRSDLGESESEREQLFVHFGVLVEAGGDPDRILEPDAEHFPFQRRMSDGAEGSQQHT